MYEQTIRRLCAYQSGRETPKLKGSRYLWLKNPGSLSGLQQERLEQFRSQCLETAKAYQLKLAFQDHTLQNGRPCRRLSPPLVRTLTPELPP